jgi:hypothetical protein
VPKPSILDAVFSVQNLYRLWNPCLQAGCGDSVIGTLFEEAVSMG